MGLLRNLFSGLSGTPASIARVMKNSYLSIKDENPDLSEWEILSATLRSRYPDYDSDFLSRLIIHYPNIRLLTLGVIGNEYGERKMEKYHRKVIEDINNTFGDVGLVWLDIDNFFEVVGPLAEMSHIALPSTGMWGVKLGMTRDLFMKSCSEDTKNRLELSAESKNLFMYERARIDKLWMDIVFVFRDSQLYEVCFSFIEPSHPIRDDLIAKYGKPLREYEEDFPSFSLNTITYWENGDVTIRLDYPESKRGVISFSLRM